MTQANTNRRAFLDMLAFSEIGPDLLAKSDNGYNVLYGGGLFHSYADHPNIKNTHIIKGRPVTSTAAGRYQILARFWFPRKKHPGYKWQLKLKDFGPAAQDAVALQMLREQGALPHIDAGRFDKAVAACANIWASLPGAGYNQHEQKIEDLRAAYIRAGGYILTVGDLPRRQSVAGA